MSRKSSSKPQIHYIFLTIAIFAVAVLFGAFAEKQNTEVQAVKSDDDGSVIYFIK